MIVVHTTRTIRCDTYTVTEGQCSSTHTVEDTTPSAFRKIVRGLGWRQRVADGILIDTCPACSHAPK